MDSTRAQAMFDDLKEGTVGGWKLLELRGNGKSAFVARAEKDSVCAAVKIFDPELVIKAGKAKQAERIEREKRLIGHDCPFLVQILDGGECPITHHLFVVMEFLNWHDLKSVLKRVPRDRIPDIVSQVAQAAKFLDESGIAHRDIKPANIGISDDFSNVKLLDLGVILPFEDPDITDEPFRDFIGTVRYSAPEFLRRKEERMPDDWRAITFYQLGGVLHDLIMKKPLFEEYSEPPGELHRAVHEIRPLIHATDVSIAAVSLARRCLAKAPISRLSCIEWSDFFDLSNTSIENIDVIRKRCQKNSLMTRCEQKHEIGESIRPLSVSDALEQVKQVIRSTCISAVEFPAVKVSVDLPSGSVVAHFGADASLGLVRPMHIQFRVEMVDERDSTLTLQSRAALGGDGKNFSDICPATTLFRGMFDDDLLEKSIQNRLWKVLEQAQHASSTQCDDSLPVCIE